MPIVRGLVVAHLGLTAALLVVFACVVLAQRLLGASGSAAPAAAPYPSDDALAARVEVPEQDAQPRRTAPSAGASVLDWTVDLRAAAGEQAALQPSS